MRLAVRGIESGEIAALLSFSELMYGKGTYQSSRRYFDWLYVRSPATRGIEDCIVALDQGAIVGCVHRMRLPCVTDSGATTLASLQNHVISPHLRGGAGIMLLQKAVKGERIAFSPGVSGRLQEAYRRLGYEELPSYWLMRMLNPLKVVAQSITWKVSQGLFPSTRLRLSDRLLRESAGGGFIVTRDPGPGQLARLAEGLAAQARQHPGAHVPWSSELLAWRYFSPLGPRHVLVERPEQGSWAILSYGLKSRVSVARLLEYEAAGDQHFVNDVLRVARRMGAALVLSYTTRSQIRDQLLSAGFRARGAPPSSFIKGTSQLSISGSATDVGFEAFLTEVAV